MKTTPAQCSTLRALVIANGHNPDAVTRTISRPPTQAEIRFGHGCRHYSEAVLPVERRFVMRDGLRWTVNR